MDFLKKIVYGLLFSFILTPLFAYAEDGDHPVLIISSYNPDARQTSRTISDFMEEFRRLGGRTPISMENMNCKSFSEILQWKGRMKMLLSKYVGKQSPSLILLIGQEAWAAYLSLDASSQGNAPVLGALVSSNTILLPNDSVNVQTWMPPSADLFKDFPNSHVRGGFVYEYDVESNIKLIKELYPQTRNIAFISDNTYGGVALQAYVVKQMKKFPELNLILLDGRCNTIYSISDKLHELPPATTLLLGTWRVDMNEGYFMRNATYTMMEAAGDLPAFSITSVGMGYWAIGGVIPHFQVLGKKIAKQAIHILDGHGDTCRIVKTIPNQIIFDYDQVKKRHLNLASIPGPIELINETPSFYEQYRYQVWAFIGVLAVLLIALFISLYYYYHTKRLKDELEVSEQALREAKEHAEEANHLKSAFLANMSHEIRTPLNAIVGFSEVLVSTDYPIEEKMTYVDIVKANSNLLLHLIDNVLDIARLESGKTDFRYEQCEVVAICQYSLFSVGQARKAENEFAFQSKYDHLEMRADAHRLQQVIIHLLSNADKFTEKGNITLTLDVNEQENIVVFSVQDTGCGIPQSKQQIVFDRFEKLNEYMQGTGLGLAICKLTVEKWGGKIWIDPDYTRGARFVFTHPLIF